MIPHDDDHSLIIPQIDGNISLDSSINSSDDEAVPLGCQIQTQIGFRPPYVHHQRPPPVLLPIQKTTGTFTSSMPTVAIFNARSLFPKLTSLITDIKERSVDICCVSEIWEDNKKKRKRKRRRRSQRFRIEEMLELEGIQYISTPRRNRRGGGAAIAVCLENFTVSKLNVNIPSNVETVWGMIKPKLPNSLFPSYIVCSFYSPPNLRRNHALVNHLTVTLQNLMNIHRNSGIYLCGDRNNIDIQTLTAIDPSLHQVVSFPTHGPNILDVICTNLPQFYQPPLSLPPLVPDDPSKGAPSDHEGVLMLPVPFLKKSTHTNKKVKLVRPLPDSLIVNFWSSFAEVDFIGRLTPDMNVDELVSTYTSISSQLLDQTFPQKRVTIYETDKPWFNEDLRKLKRLRLREYCKNGKSDKYCVLLDAFKVKSKEAISKYKEKLKDQVLQGSRGSTYPALKKLAAQPYSKSCAQISLPQHEEKGFTSLQSAEIIAQHFSKISQQYEPLNIETMPPNIQTFLSLSDTECAPILSEASVTSRIIKARKPLGMVAGDLPKKLVQKGPHLIAVPATIIFNAITRNAIYPSAWKIEEQVAIPKIQQPMSEDDLRNIAKTPFLSKIYESFIANWLLEVINPYLDPNQCGLRGSSITHYLIKLLHFIHSTLDLRDPHAVLATCIDLSKAFNRVDHSLVIQDLYDMHTPAWLLKIIFSYLSKRTMRLSFNGVQSPVYELPAGSPQGAYLGGIIFIIKFNGAFLRPSIPRPPSLQNVCSETVKFVDDGSGAVAIDLKKHLIVDTVSRPHPRTFHERTGHVLPPENNLLQYLINDTEEFALHNRMVINKKKTNLMKFSFLRKFDFPPEVYFNDGTASAKLPC